MRWRGSLRPTRTPQQPPALPVLPQSVFNLETARRPRGGAIASVTLRSAPAREVDRAAMRDLLHDLGVSAELPRALGALASDLGLAPRMVELAYLAMLDALIYEARRAGWKAR